MNRQIISLTLRLVLGLNVVFVAIAHLKIWKFYTEDASKVSSWITDAPILGNVLALVLGIIGILLLVGYKTVWASVSSVFILLLNHIALLFAATPNDPFSGPFYNTFHHSVPFIGFASLLLATFTAKSSFSIDGCLYKEESVSAINTNKNDIILLAARIFVGMIFFRQALSIFMGEGSVLKFAENVYVNSYKSSFIPTFLLWIMGVANPFILLIGSILLVLGFQTKYAAYLLTFFMVSIVFGHLLGDPFETTGDISMFGFNNLAFILFILWLEPTHNKYSIDYVMQKNDA